MKLTSKEIINYFEKQSRAAFVRGALLFASELPFAQHLKQMLEAAGIEKLSAPRFLLPRYCVLLQKLQH